MNKSMIKGRERGVGKWVSQSRINGCNSPITLNLIKGLLEVAKKQELLEVWKVDMFINSNESFLFLQVLEDNMLTPLHLVHRIHGIIIWNRWLFNSKVKTIWCFLTCKKMKFQTTDCPWTVNICCSECPREQASYIVLDILDPPNNHVVWIEFTVFLLIPPRWPEWWFQRSVRNLIQVNRLTPFLATTHGSKWDKNWA